MADTVDLKSTAEKHTSSNLVLGTKFCKRCSSYKLIVDFGRRKGNHLQTHCKICRKEYPSKVTGERRLRRLGRLGRIHFVELQEAQEGRCKLCGRLKPLVWDHDHKTDQFRGLICNGCNVGLGAFEDDILLLQKAIEYLRAP